MWIELAYSFKQGNVYILAILFLAFIALAMFFERFIMLAFVYNMNFIKFTQSLRKMISSQDYERAITLCRSVSHTSLPKITLSAIEAYENDPATVHGIIEENTLEFIPKIENRTGTLPIFATLIMLISSLAVIDNLWLSFHAVDVLDSTQKQAVLAHKVAGSLNPIAFGLLWAMLILFGHQIIKNLSLKLIDRTYHGVSVVSNLLVPRAVSLAPPAVSSAQGTNKETADNPIIKEESKSNETLDEPQVENIKDEEEII